SAPAQGEKTPACEYQAGQSCTANWTGDGHAVKHKGRVKCWRSVTADDVGADPQPIGLDTYVSCPTLKIGKTRRERCSRRHNRPWCREPQKIAIGGCHFDLRYEKELTPSQNERRGKDDRDYGFLAGYKFVAACSFVGGWLYTTSLETVVLLS